MPAYVMAYAYTDWLQFTGPVQTALRAATGWQAREYWFPEVRSLGGAAVMLSFVLYPYVYLLARTAFLELSRSAIEAGAPRRATARSARFLRVALPLARPAIVAGAALALMETLADFGTVSYFGVRRLHHRHLPGLAVDGRPRRRGAALDAACSASCVVLLALERANRGRAALSTASRRARRVRSDCAARARRSRSSPAPRRWCSASLLPRGCCSASSPGRSRLPRSARGSRAGRQQLHPRRADGAGRGRRSRW